MTVKEAAGRLEISPSLCYLLIAEGRLPHLRIGAGGRRGKIVVLEEHLADFQARCAVGSTPAQAGTGEVR